MHDGLDQTWPAAQQQQRSFDRVDEIRREPLHRLCLIVVLLLCLATRSVGGPNPTFASTSREEREPFLWGVATAAYQTEGSVSAEGRGPSIWDKFASIPGKISNNDTGAVADDSYLLWKRDIQLIKAMQGINAYRFSISWSRILPTGSKKGGINYKAILHYNRLIDELVLAGIEPLVTLYHWDLPQQLEDRYEGWLSPLIINDFKDFADACFSNFGDRVKKWVTINEPWTYALMGYDGGIFAPGRCSDRSRCAKGNSSTEPYLVAHNSLLAHAAAVELYRAKYRKRQGGSIGIVLNLDWAEPATSNPDDVAAAQRRNEFALGWFADPIVFGRYPHSMVALVKGRLPRFTSAQSKLLAQSFDFFGINHYSSKYYSAAAPATPNTTNDCWSEDQRNVESKFSQDGRLIGLQAASPWLHVVPWGFYKTLMWINERYSGSNGEKINILVTENGMDVADESKMPLAEALHDVARVDYYRQYLLAMDNAIAQGVNVRGYFAWSLLDNFEWRDGYDFRFGLHYVNFSDPKRPRFPKDSSKFYANHARNSKY